MITAKEAIKLTKAARKKVEEVKDETKKDDVKKEVKDSKK